MVDFAAALIGAVGVLQHLYERARTGAGAELGAGLMNAGLYLSIGAHSDAPTDPFEGAPVLNHEQTGYHPAEQLYEAADGWVAIAARDEAMARKLIDALGLVNAVTTPRSEWSDEVGRAIAVAVRKHPVAELLATLERVGVWAEACCANGEEDLPARSGSREARNRVSVIASTVRRRAPDRSALPPVGFAATRTRSRTYT